MEELNVIVVSFSKTGKFNKPQALSCCSLNHFRAKQTACEMWVLLRLFPLMVGHLKPRNEPKWGL